VFRPRFVGAYNCQQKAWLKIKKHQEIVTLAISKRDTFDRLLSKALADNQVSDAEFARYNVLKKSSEG